MASATLCCGDVQLKLTLASRVLTKPFEEVVVVPFLRALSKRAHAHSATVVRAAYWIVCSQCGLQCHYLGLQC